MDASIFVHLIWASMVGTLAYKVIPLFAKKPVVDENLKLEIEQLKTQIITLFSVSENTVKRVDRIQGSVNNLTLQMGLKPTDDK
jgi:chaperonin cofactor prefoldin